MLFLPLLLPLLTTSLTATDADCTLEVGQSLIQKTSMQSLLEDGVAEEASITDAEVGKLLQVMNSTLQQVAINTVANNLPAEAGEVSASHSKISEPQQVTSRGVNNLIPAEVGAANKKPQQINFGTVTVLSSEAGDNHNIDAEAEDTHMIGALTKQTFAEAEKVSMSNTTIGRLGARFSHLPGGKVSRASMSDNSSEPQHLKTHTASSSNSAESDPGKPQHSTKAIVPEMNNITFVWNFSNDEAAPFLSHIQASILSRLRDKSYSKDRWLFLLVNILALLLFAVLPRCAITDACRHKWRLTDRDVEFSISIKKLLCASSGNSSLHVYNSEDFPCIVAALCSEEGMRTLVSGWEGSTPSIFIGPLPRFDTGKANGICIQRANEGYFGYITPPEFKGEQAHTICYTANGKCMLAINTAERLSVTVSEAGQDAPIAYASYDEVTESLKLIVFQGNEPMHLVACVVATLISSPMLMLAAANALTPPTLKLPMGQVWGAHECGLPNRGEDIQA